MKKITVFEYDPKKEIFCYVGFAISATVWFKMMEYKLPEPEHIRLINEHGHIYYMRTENESVLGVFHWTKEGLLDESREKGYIS